MALCRVMFYWVMFVTVTNRLIGELKQFNLNTKGGEWLEQLNINQSVAFLEKSIDVRHVQTCFVHMIPDTTYDKFSLHPRRNTVLLYSWPPIRWVAEWRNSRVLCVRTMRKLNLVWICILTLFVVAKLWKKMYTSNFRQTI